YNDNLKALITTGPLFNELRIDENDKVISIPDLSINGSLYYMNRKGFTEFASNLSTTDGFYERIEDGAEYLIVNDSTVLSNDYLAPFIQKKIGQHGNILIFDIRNLKP
ncbi:MAG: hypothetical protein KDC64_12495, partial [Aequorivita sp.]|nr:hypothetical protein [Aequorivita sp.]